MTDLGDQPDCAALINARSDAVLALLMSNLGGHDLPSLQEAFTQAAQNDKPTLFLCYTIKGNALPLASHKDNHAGLMPPAQIQQLQSEMGIVAGDEWDKWGPDAQATALEDLVKKCAVFCPWQPPIVAAANRGARANAADAQPK